MFSPSGGLDGRDNVSGYNCIDWREVQIDDRIGEKAQDEGGDDEDEDGESQLRGGAADPCRPIQALYVVAISTGWALPVVPFLCWICSTPGPQALLMDVLLTAFAFART